MSYAKSTNNAASQIPPTKERKTSPTKTRIKSSSLRKKKEPLTLEQKMEKAVSKIKALEQELVNQIEGKNSMATARNSLIQKVDDVTGTMVQQKEDHFAIISEMTRQYKTMQDDMIKRNNHLELQVEELKEQLELIHLVLDETKKEKDRIIAEKETVIVDQARKMELMAIEFSDMLKETLEKMGERIEEASKSTKEGSLLSTKFAAQLEEFNIRIT